MAKMLDLAAKMTGYEMMSGELMIWENALSKQPSEAIEWAFTEYLKSGQYFPKPAEILGRIGIWHTQRKVSLTEKEMESNRQTRERLKESGLPAGEEQVLDIRKRLVQVAQKFPEPPSPKRRVELKERLARARGTAATAQPPNASAAATKESTPEKP